MRSFFVQIFLSFWVSSVAIFASSTLISPRTNYAFFENLLYAFRSSLTQLAQRRVEHGAAGECVQDKSLFVLDGAGREVCGASVPAQISQLVSENRNTAKAKYSRIDSSWATVERVSIDGRQFVAVLVTPFQPGSWFPHLPPFTAPVSALVTFVFAYLLTNPVRALRRAFREFAGGNMAVRLPVSRSALRDWGGADVRTLMVDFNEMADRIQALIEAHKTLLRDVSHELRSPLARLNVALELAREEAPNAADALDRAELESSRLNALIGELLSLSLMETIQDVPQPRLVLLGELVEGLMPDVTFEADTRECRVIHKQQQECPVMGSEEVLRRALENVIRNAIRHSPPNREVTIETLSEMTKEGASAVVRISDSGPGVPEESLQAIFRPFYRVDTSRQASTGGVGVGLAIADRAVHVHRGTIRAFNRNSGGLCVEFRLPCSGSRREE